MFDCGIDGGDIMPTMGPDIEPSSKIVVPAIQFDGDVLRIFITNGIVDNTSLIIYVFDKEENYLCSAHSKESHEFGKIKSVQLRFVYGSNYHYEVDENKNGLIEFPLRNNEIIVIVTTITSYKESTPITLCIGREKGGKIAITEISRRGF